MLKSNKIRKNQTNRITSILPMLAITLFLLLLLLLLLLLFIIIIIIIIIHYYYYSLLSIEK